MTRPKTSSAGLTAWCWPWRGRASGYDYSTGFYGRSYLDYSTERPQYQTTVDGDYFLEQALGGDNQFEFGFQYRKTPVESFTTYGGDAWAVFDGGEASEVWLFRPGDWNYDYNHERLVRRHV